MTIESNNLILLVWIHAVMIRERKKHGNACLVFTVQNSRRLVSGRVRRRWFRIRCLYFAWLEHILAFSKVNIFFNNENKRSNWRLLIAFDCFFCVCFAMKWTNKNANIRFRLEILCKVHLFRNTAPNHESNWNEATFSRRSRQPLIITRGFF